MDVQESTYWLMLIMFRIAAKPRLVTHSSPRWEERVTSLKTVCIAARNTRYQGPVSC